MPQHKLRWRDYRSPTGVRPVDAFIETLTDEEAADVIAAMKDVAAQGLRVARHLRAEIYEVRIDAGRRSFRILFAQETRFILLALAGLVKKSRKAPPAEIDLAESRLKDWRTRRKT